MEDEDIEVLLDSVKEGAENDSLPGVLAQMEVEGSTEDIENTEESIIYGSSAEIDPPLPSKSKEGKPADKPAKKEESNRYRPLNLPLSRIKQIMKMDPDVQLAGSDAVFSIAKATELFIELLSKDAYAFTVSSKKKTIQKKDVDAAISNTDALIFLDGALDF